MIEVHGKFIFDQDSIDFHFDHSDQVMEFGRITNMTEFKAAMIGLVTTGTDAFIKNAFSGQQGKQPATHSKSGGQANNVLEEMERRFREHQAKTQATLDKLQKDYEAATSSITGAAGQVT